GANELVVEFLQYANNQKQDITITRVGSRGMSWAEPLIEIETKEGRVGYKEVCIDDIPSILQNAITDNYIGVVDDHPYLKNQERLIFERCGIINPIKIDEYKALGGLNGLKAALSKSSQVIIDEVKISGLRGRGGAGFPTGIKWQTVHDTSSLQKYIICNADEGDSGTFADRLIMEGDPFLLIEGMVIAGLAVGASKGIIYLRSEYPLAREVLNNAISVAESSSLLGDNIQGSGKSFRLTVFMGAGAYICGEETSLLESLEGKRAMVRSKPPLPAIEGYLGKPTVVNNVLTFCSIPKILDKGGKYYQNFGVGRSKGTQAFQLAGDVKFGGLVEKAFGVSLNQIINDFGGGTRSGLPLKTAQVGGPLGAYIPLSQFGIKMDYEAFTKNEAVLGHGGIVVYNDSIGLLKQAHFAFTFCEVESCGKCTPCRIGSVRGKEVIEKIQKDGDLPEHIELLEDLCEVMVSGSLCAMGTMTPIPVKSILKHFPDEFKLNKNKEFSQ
ncbi:MAG: NADH-ubiquinone oxidoreductase-F iron-sulfur binding region domain-containing protein, partial [Sphingomonadales bacterium]